MNNPNTKKLKNKRGFTTRYGFSCGMIDIRRIGAYKIEITKDAYSWWVDVWGGTVRAEGDGGHVDFCVSTLEQARELLIRISKLARKGHVPMTNVELGPLIFKDESIHHE